MAGHSHWANIAHKKGRIDKKKGALFGKLSRAILVAARNGGPDPDTNLTLRYAIDKARKNSMPKDNIERAIKKGCGDTGGEDYVEITYEGYGPGGVAILCDALTENRNRTGGEVRKTFEVHGGNLGSTNCVSWMFELKGVFLVAEDKTTEEHLFEVAIEAGAEDVRADSGEFIVTCAPDAFDAVTAALADAEIETESAEISRVAANTVELDAEDGRKVLKLIDALEENEDVQSVTTNFNISEEVMQAVLEDA